MNEISDTFRAAAEIEANTPITVGAERSALLAAKERCSSLLSLPASAVDFENANAQVVADLWLIAKHHVGASS